MSIVSQPTKMPPTALGDAGASENSGLPTMAGPVPAGLERFFRSGPVPSLPEVSRLPAPRERCAITGASRTWLLETDERAKREGRGFLFRVRQPGKMRGAVFINTRKLLTFLQAAEAADTKLAEAEGGGKGGTEGDA